MPCNKNTANTILLRREVSLHARLTDSFVAYVGYLFTYYNSKVTEERKARIERINLQVSTKRKANTQSGSHPLVVRAKN